MKQRHLILALVLLTSACNDSKPRVGTVCTQSCSYVWCYQARYGRLLPTSFMAHGAWFEGVVEIGATVASRGGGFGCAVVDGDAYCWGDDTHGALGDEVETFTSRGPVLVQGVTDSVELSATVSGGCALDGDGRVTCWGDAGVPDRVAPRRPAYVDMPRAHAIAATFYTTCALTAQGAFCWSGGDVPVPIPNTRGATALVGGLDDICAVWPDRPARCWSFTYDKPIESKEQS